MLESFFNKVAGPDLQVYEKKNPTQVFSVKFAKVLGTVFFYRTPPVAVSE